MYNSFKISWTDICEVLGDQGAKYTEHLYISIEVGLLAKKYMFGLLKEKRVGEKAEKMDTWKITAGQHRGKN